MTALHEDTGHAISPAMKEQRMVPPAHPQSYYGRPVLKEPTWKWMIPAYFFTGGLSAGSALLAAGGRARGNDALARAANVIAVSAVATSGGLLVGDLGKPNRFYNMLRVAKPTSPMSMGTWLLSAYGPATGVATVCDLTGLLPRVGRLAEAVAALLAPAVATYTAVLVSDTAIPVWHEAGGELPLVFASGAALSAGGVLFALLGPERGQMARRAALIAGVAELAAVQQMEHQLGEVGEVYHRERAGTYTKLGKAAIAAGAAVIATSGRSRMRAALGGVMVAGGALAERFAVFEAGKQSARDPKYTVGPQRARASQGGNTLGTWD